MREIKFVDKTYECVDTKDHPFYESPPQEIVITTTYIRQNMDY